MEPEDILEKALMNLGDEAEYNYIAEVILTRASQYLRWQKLDSPGWSTAIYDNKIPSLEELAAIILEAPVYDMTVVN